MADQISPAPGRHAGEPGAWAGFVASAALGLWIWLGHDLPLAPSLLAIGGLGLAALIRRPVATVPLMLAGLLVAFFVTLAWFSHCLPGSGSPDPGYATALALRELLVAWAALLWVPRDAERPAQPHRPGFRPALVASTAFALVTVLAVSIQLLPTGTSGITDEVLYIFQAEMFRQGELRAPLPDELRPFFAIVNTVPGQGTLHTQYPPGWPLLLSLFDRAGLHTIAPYLVGSSVVGGTLLAARQVGGLPAATFAVLALAMDYPALRYSSAYLAHGAASAALLGMLVALVQAARSGHVRWTLLAGGLAGFATITRPLTGLCLGLAIGLWVYWTERGLQGNRLGHALALCGGGLIPAAGFLAYNLATNDAPLTLGYTEAHGGSHALGFGAQQRYRYAADGSIVTVSMAPPATDPLRRLATNLLFVAQTALPASLLLPMFWFALRVNWRPRAAALGFLLLPLGYVFWINTTYRAMAELLPFVAIAVGSAASALWSRTPRWTAGATALALVAAIATAPPAFGRDPGLASRWRPHFTRIHDAARDGPILVFVNRGNEPEDTLFEKLFLFNAQDWMGDVIVARDLGARNVELARRFPGHRAWRLRSLGAPAGTFAFEPLPDPVP